MRSHQFVAWAYVAITSLLFLSCSSAPKTAASKNPEPAVLSNTSMSAGGFVITDEMIGRRRGTMHLSRTATDPAYAYSERLPVMVGGGFGEGSDRTYKYLNSLLGPKGEAIKYSRVGTCCPFKSPNSHFEGGGALLEVYEVSIPGAAPMRLYFNWYDEGEVLVPVGLSAVQ
jgi:hypothetical protein